MAPPSGDVVASSSSKKSKNEEIHQDDIVISGMAGKFPESQNVYEFRENLFNKVDMVTDDARRWVIDHPEVPRRTGKLPELSKFDASFFAVHYKQAHTMDPMCRMLLELAYEAIVDAGVNPMSLRGSNTGCFIGACFSESEKIWFYERIQMHGFGITGCSRAMLANRISYWLGIHGPSYAVDTACSSSLYALDHAVRAIRLGQCDSALVGGANLTLHPYISLQFARLGVLSPDGKCKSFDADGDGYCRSETIAMIYLQKAKDARRIYATVVHTKTNCDGFKEQGITFPSGHMQGQLLQECYEECGVSFNDLKYYEAHGTGTKVGDPEELNTIDRTICSKRDDPLLVGSIKSNIGHSEPASALSAIIKVVIGMEAGLLAPNLHYKSPRAGIPALSEGRIKIVTDVTPWDGGTVGVSSFGFGGANAHAVLRSNPYSKPAIDQALIDKLPRLIVTSGRTEEAVEAIIGEFEKNPVDSEYVALLQSVHSESIPGHIYRGFSVLHADCSENAKKIRDVKYYPGAKRPLWFVFAGMGSQWAGMGKELLRLPVFAKAIDRCDAVLRPKGLDIKHIITHEDPKLFDNILNSFVGIAAIQVGLVDVLTEAGIVPDGIVGHSVGELGCAYADGCFTAEQMVLAAYSRGLASIETPLIHGSMAAVGLSHDVAAPMCPHDVEVACHNGTDSCTISGPAESITKFVSELKEKEIFAREVACSNIAYHSRYIAKAGPKLLHYLKQVIPEPKRRSEKWISSSVPKSRWGETATQFSSPEYHTNNLLCPVLFDEAVRHIPPNAITVEIAPHALLQAILRRTLSPECTNIPLTQRGAKNGIDILFSAFGKLYVEGLHPQLLKIHPPVQFPVSRGTPMISPLIRWQHTDDWHVATYKNEEKLETGERTVALNIKNDDEFLMGHVIDGRNLFPATGYLWLAWETLAMMNSMMYTNLPIVFEKVKFLRACYIPSDGNLELTIIVTKGTGTFEVVEGGTAVVTGKIYIPEDIEKEMLNLPPPRVETTPLTPPPLTGKDVYKELRLRGYNYAGIFKAITELNSTGIVGKLKWENNYVAFMDALLQLQIFQLDSRSLYVPTALQRLVIHPLRHREELLALDENMEFPMYYHSSQNVLHSGGIEIRGLQASVIARRKPTAVPVLEAHQLVPYRPSIPLSLPSALRVCTHLVLENISTNKPKVVEWVSPIEVDPTILLGPKLPAIFGDLPLISPEIIISGSNATLTESLEENDMMTGLTLTDTKLAADMAAHLVMCGDGGSMLSLPAVLADALTAVTPGGFFLLQLRRGNERGAEQTLEGLGVAVVAVLPCSEEAVLVLARKVQMAKNGEVKVVNVPESKDIDFTWVEEIQNILKAEKLPRRLYLVSQNAPHSGLLGFTNCLINEVHKDIIRCVFILDKKAPPFLPEDPTYARQLRADLIQNVLPADGRGWSSYRHTLLDIETVEVPHAYVNVTTRGDLSSFSWLQGPITDLKRYNNLKCSNNMGKKLYHIYYSALNFRDVMTATGKLAVEVVAKNRLSQDCVQGLEFSGRDINGKRVMGLTISGALANVALIYPSLVWDVPADWTLEEAATVPVVYCTVYVALLVKGRMRSGESILIHAGTGGVGQAAINVCLHMGCKIFVTVGTPEKRAFLHKHFPQIPDANIGNSRDTSFEQMIMQRTNGKGVDLVLNSLAGDKLQASLRCLTFGGRFLEIGKVDMAADTPIGMNVFLKDTSIHGIFLDAIIEGDEVSHKDTYEILAQGIRNGAVKPLIRQIFGPDQVETAFRFMASGKHIGKVLLKIRDEETDGTTRGKPIEVKPILKLVEAITRYFCDPEKTYIIIGGLGGFGLELADWLVVRGARKLVLSSRSGVRNGYQAWRIRTWQSYGATIEISRAEVTCEQGCITLLESATRKLGPVAAIFNLAVVLKDGLFEDQNSENFAVSYLPKAQTTALLDKVSRRLCPNLEHFVAFSSVSCGRGNIGQTNYGYSNSIMERICESRRADGLPGLAIQWGAIGDVGIVAENMTEDREGAEPLVIGGTLQQRIFSCLEVLDTFLTIPCDDPNSPAVVASMVVAEKATRGGSSTTVVDTVVNILGIRDLKTVSMHSTLAELGMDSMMAVEIKQTLEREFEMYLSPQDIRGLTFAKLTELAQKIQDQFRARQEAALGNTEEDNAWIIGGLHHLIGVVGNPKIAALPIVQLPSQGGETARTVFMVPGIEGVASVMEPLAKQLNYPIRCLQMPMDISDHSVKELSQILLERMQESQPTGPYFLLGYSYGTLLLLEMAWELQVQGHDVRIALIDGALHALYNVANKSLALDKEREAEWEVNFLEKLLIIIGVPETFEIAKELTTLPDWDARLKRISEYFPNEDLKEYHSACVTSCMKRLTGIMKYNWPEGRKLKCPITLIRTMNPLGGCQFEDYGLHQISERKVSVHLVEGTHTGIILSKRTADIINQDAFMLQ